MKYLKWIKIDMLRTNSALLHVCLEEISRELPGYWTQVTAVKFQRLSTWVTIILQQYKIMAKKDLPTLKFLR
jgi:hypothetical protein